MNDNPLFQILFSAGAIFIFIGMFMQLFPPREINRTYGYRSKSAMQDFAHWTFAQTYCSQQFVFIGMMLALISVASIFIYIPQILGIFIGLVLVLLAFWVLHRRVELAIKKKFMPVE